MKLILFLMVFSLIWIPVLIYLARYTYKKWCLSQSNRAKSDDLKSVFKTLIYFLVADIFVLILMVCFIYDIVKGGY